MRFAFGASALAALLAIGCQQSTSTGPATPPAGTAQRPATNASAVKKLTLTMRKGDMALQFVWTFSDNPADWPEFDPSAVAHESGDYEDDFETAAVCTDLEGRPMPNGGGCYSGSDPGRGR